MSGAIRPYESNPRYWQFRGRPVFPLGGTKEDNLFQIPTIDSHLRDLAAAGGNYVRCTMSSRDPGDVWPHEKDEETGLFDLDTPGSEYWHRMERFLELTHEYGIIVQIELWDRFDFSRDPWQSSSWNPVNNVNYTEEETGLATAYPEHPGRNQQPFFYSVPALNDMAPVLRFQMLFLEELIQRTGSYDHVLYCVDNETSGAPEWSEYWAKQIIARLPHAMVTEMWDPWDLSDPVHDRTFGNPQLYRFADVSQNNHNDGDLHWSHLQSRWHAVAKEPRPLNMVKIYGADGNKFGHSNDEAIGRFWRGLLGGAAALRFHRPPSGLGLSTISRTQIAAARCLFDVVPPWELRPDSDFSCFGNRKPDHSYCAVSESAIVIYLPRGGTVSVRLDRSVRVYWLDLERAAWVDDPEDPKSKESPPCVPDGGFVTVIAPSEDHWVAVLK